MHPQYVREKKHAVTIVSPLMIREPLPDDVRRFILVSVPSIPFLEAMLLLREDENRVWDSKLVAQRLYMSEKAVQDLLAELHEAGILHAQEQGVSGYSYRPGSAELRSMIDRLADIYAKNLVDVTNLVHSTIGKKAQHFADAFKWRKDS
jgi:Mn-dependent DtxR family transcriptional regulator